MSYLLSEIRNFLQGEIVRQNRPKGFTLLYRATLQLK
jgi:hypothetical protein